MNCAKFPNFDRFCSQNRYKQSLQTASASGKLRPPDLLSQTWASPLDPMEDFCLPDSLGYNPQLNIFGAATAEAVRCAVTYLVSTCSGHQSAFLLH